MDIKLKNTVLFILLTLVQILLNSANAQLFNIDKNNELLSVSSELLLYEDKSGNIEIKDIIKYPDKFGFKKTKASIPSYSFTKSTICDDSKYPKPLSLPAMPAFNVS